MFGLPTLYSKKLKPLSQSNYLVMKDSHRLFGHEKSIGVLGNNQSHNLMLEKALRKATMMWREKAFLHHFEKFGVTNEKFSEAFLTCETTLAEYLNL